MVKQRPSHHLTLVASSESPEHSTLDEPLQSADHIVLRGVLSNVMPRHEVRDAADVILKCGDVHMEDRSALFVKARSVLLLSNIITDLELLDDSPTVLGTARGSIARVISSVHLQTLRDAFRLEETPATSKNVDEIFAYRYQANTTIESCRETNAVRILTEIKKTKATACGGDGYAMSYCWICYF